MSLNYTISENTINFNCVYPSEIGGSNNTIMTVLPSVLFTPKQIDAALNLANELTVGIDHSKRITKTLKNIIKLSNSDHSCIRTYTLTLYDIETIRLRVEDLASYVYNRVQLLSAPVTINTIDYRSESALAAFMLEELYSRSDCVILLDNYNKVLAQLNSLKNKEVDDITLVHNNGLNDIARSLHLKNALNKENKEKKYMFKFSLANKNKNKTMSMTDNVTGEIIKLSTEYEYESVSIRFVLGETEQTPVVQPKPVVTLFSIDPTLKSDIYEARKYITSRFMVYQDINDTDSDVLYKSFDMFNNLKTKFMLHGYSEHRVTKMLYRLMNRKKKMPEGYFTCAVTKQFLPIIFSQPVVLSNTNVQVLVSYRYIQLCNNRNYRTTPLFNRNEITNSSDNSTEHFFTEVKLNADKYYGVTVFNSSLRTQSLLSPRWLDTENTKTFGKNSKYTPTPWLGIELEVERRGSTMPEHTTKCPEDITEHCYNALGRDYVIFKTDGSLRGHAPWEIVTVPATLNYHKERWENFMSNTKLKSNLQSYTSGNCGMHVHISRDSFNGLHLAKFMRFINMDENSKFITKIGQRTQNRYCAYTKYKSISSAANQLHGGDRYRAVNLTNTNTVEVRIFRGNLSKTAFFKNLEFVHAAWAYTKNASMKELDYKSFLLWLHDPKNMHDKQYANLQTWSIANSFNVSNIMVPRDTPKEQRLKLEQKRIKIKKVQLIINRRYATNTECDTIGKGKGKITKQSIVINQ